MKVRKNEANPFEIRSMITAWEHEMYFRLCEEREKKIEMFFQHIATYSEQANKNERIQNA
jgi:hypothetical protein